VAAAAAAQTAHAVADDTLGKAHPPLVAENDPTIVAKWGTLRRPDTTIRVYSARPKVVSGSTPGIVVIPHIWGVDTSIRDCVRRYAKAGYVAAAPDLYSRFDAPTGDGVTDVAVFRPYAKQLQRDEYGGDIRGTQETLAKVRPNAKVGITGFCMGGHIVLEEAVDNGDVFAVAAPFYGAVENIDPNAVHIPICGSYGERDTSIPAADVRAFAAALDEPHDIKIYPEAGHAFFDDQRAAYVPSAAADAWQRTLTFFAKWLAQS
jgi:carboxymethylenebutenolidase